MADGSNGNFYAPWPGVFQQGGGDDDDSFRAALISQGDASTQRNQDAAFSAVRSQLVHRDVIEGKFDAVVSMKDGEIRTADRFSSVEKELAALRAEAQARDIAQLRAELAESKAEARSAATTALLSQILAKLP